MSKINETNYPRRTQANYADTDMLVIQAAGGNTYTTRLEDMREDYEATLAPTLSALQDDINENLATIEGGSTASKVYAKGDYLVFGGKLCRVTSTSIAAGATLTIGTNIELAPVGDELKTLSSDLSSHSWTPISAISGGKYDIVQNAHYTQSYIQRYGHLVLVEAVVTCNTSHSGSTPVFYVPAPMDFTTIHIPKFMETPTSGIDSLLQNGIIYAYNGVAGKSYSISFMYIANSIPS